MAQNDLIYPADLANSEPVVVENGCNCNCGCHGIYWMPPPPPPDYPDTPPTPPEGIKPPPPPFPYPWGWPYPYYPPFFPPPPPPPKPDDGSGDDPDKPDPPKPDDPDNPKPPSQDEIQEIEKQIQALTKKLATIKCMIKCISEKKKDVIIKTDCCSYNFGNIDTAVDGWDDVSYAQTVLRILYKEKSLISEKIKELAEKISEDVNVDGTTVCACENETCDCNND